MLRRYRTFARLTIACFGALLVCASPAIAARGEPSGLEALWKAFPLNPTGERFKATQEAETQRAAAQPDDRPHERPFVSPTTEAVEETVAPASDRNPRLIALVLTVFVLLGALIALRPHRTRHSSSPPAIEGGSARVPALPAIGVLVAVEALYGYAIYTLVVHVL